VGVELRHLREIQPAADVQKPQSPSNTSRPGFNWGTPEGYGARTI
jgi:hypothetical protein